MSGPIDHSVAIVLITLVGGALPLARRWSERVLHLFVAGATGVFLGAACLHLLPEFAKLGPGRDAWALMAISIVLLFAIEHVGLAPSHGTSTHRVLGYTTLIGLSIHSLAAGYALGISSRLALGHIVFLAVVTHKAIEAFSLSTVLLLADRGRASVLGWVGLFSLMVPLGTVVGHWSADSAAPGALVMPLALATGTFIYVSLCDLLPEVFHHRSDALAKVVLIVAGLVASHLLTGF